MKVYSAIISCTPLPTLSGLIFARIYFRVEGVVPLFIDGVNLLTTNKDFLNFVVEDNKLKQNKLIPGVDIPIVSKQKIDRKDNTVVVLAWNFFKEIAKSNKKLGNNFINIKTLERDDIKL